MDYNVVHLRAYTCTYTIHVQHLCSNVNVHEYRLTPQSHVIQQIDALGFSGVSLHYTKNLFFVSLNNGVVYRIENQSDTAIYQTSNGCHSLDVDWLNDHLYIAEKDQVRRRHKTFEVMIIRV